jgi:ribosome-binding factor A
VRTATPRGLTQHAMPKVRTGAPSQRQLRVGEELRHALARFFAQGGLRDPALAETTLTVTEVRVGPDLKSATAYVVPLGGVEIEAAVTALNHAAGFIRAQLAREVRLRSMPRLDFAADRSFDEADRIRQILDRPSVRRDLEGDEDAGHGGGDGA